jgi:hypothetical protein
MTEETDGKETKFAGVEIHPPEGEQERSHESEDTLSPDEKSGDGGQNHSRLSNS